MTRSILGRRIGKVRSRTLSVCLYNLLDGVAKRMTQGEVWEVIRMNPTVSFKTKAPGPFMLLQAAEGINMRWVSTTNDDNFSVEVLGE